MQKDNRESQANRLHFKEKKIVKNKQMLRSYIMMVLYFTANFNYLPIPSSVTLQNKTKEPA